MVFLEWLVEMRRKSHSRVTGTAHRRIEAASEPHPQSPAAASRRPLGDLLLERRLISPEQLHAALEQQSRPQAARKLLGEILIAMTGMSEEQLVETLAMQARSILGLEAARPAEVETAPPSQSPPGRNPLVVNPLALLNAEPVRVADDQAASVPEWIPEWIREYSQHPELLAPARIAPAAAGPPPPGSLVEEVALLHREPRSAPLPSPRPAKLPVVSAAAPGPASGPHQTKPSRRSPMLHGMSDQPETPSPSRRILVALGTRPEAIKLAPVIRELQRSDSGDGALQPDPQAARRRVFVCVTGQQQEMVEEELYAAGVRVDLNLNLATRDQAPAELGARMLQVFSAVIEEFAPDWVMVQGHTVTSSMASLAALYAGVRVAHVEAGVLTSDPAPGPDAEPSPEPAQARRPPSPEAFNRRLIGLAAQVHFAPTQWARQNLLREGIAPQDILVTGNTGIDALRSQRERTQPTRELPGPGSGPVRILVSASLRDPIQGETYESRIAILCAALHNLISRHPGRFLILWPLDPDPILTELAVSLLTGLEDILLAEAARHDQLLEYLEKSDIVLTDSAAVQEEAPSFGKPVLILRETTERPEGVLAGLAWLIGLDRDRIERALEELGPQVAERRTLRSASNPYGDGFASLRIADFFAGRKVVEFGAPAPEPTRARMELLQPAGAA